MNLKLKIIVLIGLSLGPCNNTQAGFYDRFCAQITTLGAKIASNPKTTASIAFGVIIAGYLTYKAITAGCHLANKKTIFKQNHFIVLIPLTPDEINKSDSFRHYAQAAFKIKDTEFPDDTEYLIVDSSGNLWHSIMGGYEAHLITNLSTLLTDLQYLYNQKTSQIIAVNQTYEDIFELTKDSTGYYKFNTFHKSNND